MSTPQRRVGPKFRVSLGETAGAMKVADRFRAVIGPPGGKGGACRLFPQPPYRPHLARRRAVEYGIVGINEGIISTALADRFIRLIGAPPMHYLANWRQDGVYDARAGSKYGFDDNFLSRHSWSDIASIAK